MRRVHPPSSHNPHRWQSMTPRPYTARYPLRHPHGAYIHPCPATHTCVTIDAHALQCLRHTHTHTSTQHTHRAPHTHTCDDATDHRPLLHTHTYTCYAHTYTCYAHTCTCYTHTYTCYTHTCTCSIHTHTSIPCHTMPYHAMPYLPCLASPLCLSDRRMHSAALIRLHHPEVRRTGGCRTTRLHYRIGPMRPHTWTSGHAHDAVTSGIV